jgi:excisionase family DNA binding protein
METIDVDPVERLLDVHEVADRLGLSKDTIYVMIAEKRFPQPMKLGNRPRWSVREFNAYVADLRKKQMAEAEEEAKKRRARRARA